MEEGEEDEVVVYGDLLETILSYVPLVDLVSASGVSKCRRRSFSSSLRHRNPPKPWLLLHTQATRFPHATTSYAYDPRSDVWIQIHRPSIPYVSALRSSHSYFLYMLSPSGFSFSVDRLSSDWCTVSPPRVWRTDPIVAQVGDAFLIAGASCYFEDDPLAVEIYDLKTREWRTGESMPSGLKDFAASSWLSVATTDEKLVVVDKQSGVIHWFDPETNSWSGTFVLNPGQPISSYHVGRSSVGLILVGVSQFEEAQNLRIWRVTEDDLSCEEIGKMPEEFVERLKISAENSSIDVRMAGTIVYVYNTWEAEEVVSGGRCRWWSVRNVISRERMIAEKLVFSCAEVGIGELQQAMMMNWRFEVAAQ